jgi:hypothetical protein
MTTTGPASSSTLALNGRASDRAHVDPTSVSPPANRRRLAGCGRALCAAAPAETRIHVATRLAGGWARGPVCAACGGDRSRHPEARFHWRGGLLPTRSRPTPAPSLPRKPVPV